MEPWLLDVNVLLGLLWPSHAFHASALNWFLEHREEGWATCPLTEIGFLRVVTNPVFSPDAPDFGNAIEMLTASKQESRFHRFWPASIPCEEVASIFGERVSGHKQIPDVYLLSLAMHHGGKLLTFDRRILHLAPEGSAERAALTILEP
jgi:toxin-antitoxin system PIN domain toxin